MKRSFSGQRPDSPVEVLLRAKPNHGNTAGVQQVLFFWGGGGVGVLRCGAWPSLIAALAPWLVGS